MKPGASKVKIKSSQWAFDKKPQCAKYSCNCLLWMTWHLRLKAPLHLLVDWHGGEFVCVGVVVALSMYVLKLLSPSLDLSHCCSHS